MSGLPALLLALTATLTISNPANADSSWLRSCLSGETQIVSVESLYQRVYCPSYFGDPTSGSVSLFSEKWPSFSVSPVSLWFPESPEACASAVVMSTIPIRQTCSSVPVVTRQGLYWTLFTADDRDCAPVVRGGKGIVLMVVNNVPCTVEKAELLHPDDYSHQEVPSEYIDATPLPRLPSPIVRQPTDLHLVMLFLGVSICVATLALFRLRGRA